MTGTINIGVAKFKSTLSVNNFGDYLFGYINILLSFNFIDGTMRLSTPFLAIIKLNGSITPNPF
ncbi:hypothetical protein [Staphylococcus sp. TE8]|uniref:hypothetical protein n=1 Tax=Staphylococcus sp. TE8 TaxID=1472720 RepID=UPI0018CC47FC|nr:hypothetical protein [Staphylococcus sp. TE8]